MYKVALAIVILSWSAVHSLNSFAQQKIIRLDLLNKGDFQVINRTVGLSTDKQGKTIIHLDAKPDVGVAWINNTNFTTGIIEFTVKGKDVLQQSFLGIAFHEINDSSFDAIYFRPFNFRSIDTARRNHSVQYISMPKYDWSYLRQNYPGKYENALTEAIEPKEWFHAKILVSNESIKVFVNDDDKPSLVVKPLSNSISGKIGFWVGNNSDGDFSNLILTTN